MKTTETGWSKEVFQFIQTELKITPENLKITKLAGDASSRVYWRLDSQKNSWILMENDPFKDLDTFPYINIQRHLKKKDVHVPNIYASNPGLGILLIEDFGDNFLEKVTQNLAPKQYSKYYFMALDELFKIHFNASKKNKRCLAFGLAFDTEKLLWELNFMKTHLIQGHLKISSSKTEEETLNSSFLKICKFLDGQPRYFTHRDYHSRNLMITPQGKIGVLDFQDARMGPCQYDLCSLLKDSYVQLPKDLIDELIKYYLFEKKKIEGTIDEIEFRRIFDWMSIQRNLKAMGTFAYLHLEKEKSNYLKHLKPTWNYVSENLEKFPELKDLHKILSHYMERL